jgi:hypothetical protein
MLSDALLPGAYRFGNGSSKRTGAVNIIQSDLFILIVPCSEVFA